MPEELSPEKIVRHHAALKGQRSNFDTYYQTLHDYFYVEGDNINTTYYPGTELDFFYLLDATSLEIADILPAGISNYLTPTTGRWFNLEHPQKALRDRKDVRQWMQDTTDEVNFVLNRSNFYNQMPIFYKASGVYGTAMLMIEDDPTDDIRFYTIPIRHAFLTEDAREKPLEFYLDFSFTAEQAYTKFGENVDPAIKEAMSSRRNPDKKYDYIYYLGPRQIREYGKTDRQNMAFRGSWVEKITQHTMSEDGFNSMPGLAHRFYKRPLTPYGFSPGMKALPWVRMLNTMADTVLRAAMKHSDPPIAVPDQGFLANMNFNPRAVNYYKKGKLDPTRDIAPIGNYGNIGIGMAEIEYYAKQAGDMFFKSAFLQFQDVTKQMTVPEVMQRANEQLTLLGPAVGRYMSDVLQPGIETVIGKLWTRGRLPPLPESMRLRPEFDVKFVGRLAQAQKQSEVNNITNALSIAGEIAQFKPEALDKINVDAAIDEVWSVSNAPAGMIYDNEEVKKIRAAKQKQLKVIEQIQMAAETAKAGKDATQADKNLAQAEAVGAPA